MRRTLRLLAGLGLLALLLTPATGGAAGVPAAQADGTQADGRELYLQHCASCHGLDPSGPAAYNTVPSLAGVGGAAAIDWVLRTGRMPMQATVGQAQRGKQHFNPDQTRALVEYIGRAVGDTELPTVDPSQGDLVEGRRLYGQNCAACHGMNGAGAALGGDNNAPSLQGIDALTVAEAMKIGPGPMPVFTEFSQQEVNSIARYAETLGRGRYDVGGAPIGGKGPVPEGFVAWVIGLGALVFVAWRIGGRS